MTITYYKRARCAEDPERKREVAYLRRFCGPLRGHEVTSPTEALQPLPTAGRVPWVPAGRVLSR
jgi:hypothetical protein